MVDQQLYKYNILLLSDIFMHYMRYVLCAMFYALIIKNLYLLNTPTDDFM